jgi:hypothetical protein
VALNSPHTHALWAVTRAAACKKAFGGFEREAEDFLHVAIDHLSAESEVQITVIILFVLHSVLYMMHVQIIWYCTRRIYGMLLLHCFTIAACVVHTQNTLYL